MVAFFTPVMMPPPGGSPSFSYTVLSSASSSVSASSHTFSGILSGSYGYIVVAVDWLGNGASRTLSSATIGGNAATIMTQINESTGFTGCALLIAAAAGMSTTDVVLNMSGATNRWGAQAYGIPSLVSSTPSSVATNSGSLPKIASVTPQTGGVVFASGALTLTGGFGGSGITQDYASGNLSPGELFAGSLATNSTSTISVAVSVSGNGSVAVAALK